MTRAKEDPMKVKTALRRRTPKRLMPGEEGDDPERYQMKAVLRALDVLESFPGADARMNLREISQRTGHPESSLFRILRTLESRGYVDQDADGAYRLPERFLGGQQELLAEHVRAAARPFLLELRDRFNETASLAFLFARRIEVLDTVDGQDEVRMTNTPGRIVPPHASSLGKAVTAFQPPALMNAILDSYGLTRRTPSTITDRHALLGELERVRQAGHAFDREESVLGGLCVGAPVERQGAVIGAISVSTPLLRMTPEKQAAIVRQVMAAAGKLSKVLAQNRKQAV